MASMCVTSPMEGLGMGIQGRTLGVLPEMYQYE